MTNNKLNIKVNKIPVAEVHLHKAGFEKELKKSFDFKKAIIENLEMISCNVEDKKRILNFIFIATDWGDIIRSYKIIKEDKIQLKVYKCEINGLTTYKPSHIDTEEGVFHLNEQKTNKTDFMVVAAFNSRVDHHLEYMLAQNLIDFLNFEWKRLFTLEDGT